LKDSEPKEFIEYFCELKMAYLANRKTIWKNIQVKVGKILDVSSNFIISLPTNEFMNFLIYSNKFIEIGEDFSLLASKEYFNKKNIFRKLK